MNCENMNAILIKTREVFDTSRFSLTAARSWQTDVSYVSYAPEIFYEL